MNRLGELQDRIAEKLFRKYAVAAMYLSYGFVFFFFGLQKPAPVVSPPKYPISSFISELGLGLPIKYVILFIGIYEMTLGLLFLFKKLRAAFWMFLPHQLIAFTVLATIPFEIFQPPWIELGLLKFPWLLDSFSAFVMKNLIFVAGFMLLYKVEMLEKPEDS